MAIEINGLPPTVAKKAETGATAPKQHDQPGVQKQETPRVSPSDTVNLTDGGAHLQALEKSLVSLPVVDTQRVEQTRKAIAEGSYTVETGRIADKLLYFEHLLDDKPKK